MRLIRRLWYLVRQRRFETDLAQELEVHRDLAARELEQSGLTSAEAAVEARRRLGNAGVIRDDARDVWGWTWLQDISQDMRFAGRRLMKDAGFTVAVVLALGLGVGANNSVFTVINTALIRDVPFDEPERLLDLGVINRDGREVGLSYPDYRDWSDAGTLEGISVSMDAVMNLSDPGRPPERLRGTYVSANTFGLLRSKPVVGRDFRPADDEPGAPPVAIIGHGVWLERYGGDPSVVGRSVTINSVGATIVGVMAPGFRYPFIAEAWQPLSSAPTLQTDRRDVRPFRNVIARMGDGADLTGAQAEMETIAAGLANSFPDSNKDLRPKIQLMSDGHGGRQAKAMLMTFMGAVGFLLLIACANVANLLLTRALARSREIAIRTSLGATRWRIVRELLVECVVLAAGAGAAGILFSLYGAKALAVGFSPIEPGVPSGTLMPFWIDLSIDGTVLAFVGTVCLLSTLLFGLVPAMQAAKVDVSGALKEAGRAGDGRPARRWTSAFIITEVALTVVLLVGAGLLWRSFYAKYRTDLVLNTSNLVTARLTLPIDKYDTAGKRSAFFQRVEERLAGVPVFSGVTVASHAPLALGGASRQLAIEGGSAPVGATLPSVSYVYTGAMYFETLGLQLRRGRALTEADGLPGREAAIIDERLAALYFTGTDPIGRQIRLLGRDSAREGRSILTIVGVAPTMPDFRPGGGQPVVYVPLRAEPTPGRDLSLIVRGNAGLPVVVSRLRDEVRAIDGDLPLYGIETVDAAAARSRSPQRLVGTWFGIIAFIAVVLSTVGLYALTAYGVARRTQEIGVRMALGARAHQVTWLFLRRTVVHLSIGLALGVCGALATGQLLQSLLVQTDARDPLTLAGVVALLAFVAVAASLVPSRRAACLDPVVALRAD